MWCLLHVLNSLPTTLEPVYATVIFNLFASYVEKGKAGYKGHV